MATETSNDETHKHAHAAHAPAKHKAANGRRAVHHNTRTAGLLALQDQAAETIDGVTRQLADLKKKGAKSAKALETTVIENPKSSILIAFGVGYILARLRRWI